MRADATAKPAGQTPTRIELRATDARTFRLDCSALLRQYELMSSVKEVRADGLKLLNVRCREGQLVEFLFDGVSVDLASSSKDFPVCFLLNTTQGILTAMLQVRVYAG